MCSAQYQGLQAFYLCQCTAWHVAYIWNAACLPKAKLTPAHCMACAFRRGYIRNFCRQNRRPTSPGCFYDTAYILFAALSIQPDSKNGCNCNCNRQPIGSSPFSGMRLGEQARPARQLCPSSSRIVRKPAREGVSDVQTARLKLTEATGLPRQTGLGRAGLGPARPHPPLGAAERQIHGQIGYCGLTATVDGM